MRLPELIKSKTFWCPHCSQWHAHVPVVDGISKCEQTGEPVHFDEYQMSYDPEAGPRYLPSIKPRRKADHLIEEGRARREFFVTLGSFVFGLAVGALAASILWMLLLS